MFHFQLLNDDLINVMRVTFSYEILLNGEVLLDVFILGVSVKMATAVWMVTEPIMQLFC